MAQKNTEGKGAAQIRARHTWPRRYTAVLTAAVIACLASHAPRMLMFAMNAAGGGLPKSRASKRALSDLLRAVDMLPSDPTAPRRISAAAAALEGSLPRGVSWNSGDLSLLDGEWELMYTNNAIGSRSGFLAPLATSAPFVDLPALNTGRVRQVIDVAAQRLQNIVSLAPWPKGVELPGPLGEVLDQLDGADITLVLDHSFATEGRARLRINFEELRRSLAREDEAELTGLAGAIPSQSIYQIPWPLSEVAAGRFDTIFVDEAYRVSRGAPPGQELRVFRRVK